MGLDSVVLGAIASVVVAIVIIGFIAYKIVKSVDESGPSQD